MDRNKVSRADTLVELRLLVDNITSHVDGFNFLDSLTSVHALNTWPLFRLVVGPDERKNDRYVIKVRLKDNQCESILSYKIASMLKHRG